MSKSKQVFRERECIHREQDAEGDFYNGTIYVQSLQRLSTEEAMKVAGKVSPFFWTDAAHILVWLCRNCAAELRVNDSTGVPIFRVRHG